MAVHATRQSWKSARKLHATNAISRAIAAPTFTTGGSTTPSHRSKSALAATIKLALAAVPANGGDTIPSDPGDEDTMLAGIPEKPQS